MDILDTDLRGALRRGVAALAALQAPDGAFAVAGSSERPPWHGPDPIFSTACVLVAAGELLPGAATTAALDFVAERRRGDGLWAWEGCPTDADDSAMCLAALIGAGRLNASEASRLRQFWSEPSGPFRTWPEGFGNAKRPCDPVVNCNVLYCLATSGIAVHDKERIAVGDLVERAVKSSGRFSLYYHFKSTLFYAAARAGLGPILSEPRSEGLHAQQTAEVLAAWPGQNPALVHRLLAAQRDDGSWTGTPWFFDQAGDYCSDAYATAVAVEALSRLLDKFIAVQEPRR